jgi:phage repressor protein C with HTH and peptisase S24 domain
MRRWAVVLVKGPSMVPTLRDGDAVVVRRGNTVSGGDVVLARFRSEPALLVVKRAVRPVDGGWWIESDNAFVTDDSRSYGVADVEAKVLWRYLPVRRAGRLARSPRPI